MFDPRASIRNCYQSPLAHSTKAYHRAFVWSVALAKYRLIVKPEEVGEITDAITPVYVAMAKGKLFELPESGYVIVVVAVPLVGERLTATPPWLCSYGNISDGWCPTA